MIDLKKVKQMNFVTNEVNDLLVALNKRDLSAGICAVNALAVTNEGLVTPGGTMPITEDAMLQFLKKLDPPINKKYAFGISTDQFLFDINKVIEDDVREIMYYSEDGAVTGFCNPAFQPVNHGRLLESISESYNIKDVVLSPKLMKIRIANHELNIGPNSEDIIHPGLEILNSETAHCQLQSTLMLYRVICSNGAIVQTESGYRYIQEQKNRDQETILNGFILRMEDYTWQLPHMKDILKVMTSTKNKELDIVPRRHIPFIQTDADYRGIAGIVHMMKGIVGKEQMEACLLSHSDDTIQYDTFNAITAAAKQFDVEKSRRLDLLGGVMVSYNLARMAA